MSDAVIVEAVRTPVGEGEPGGTVGATARERVA